jgi:hypothetical protein
MMVTINESKFFHRRIDLGRVQELVQEYAKEVFYDTKSFEQFKYEVVLKAVEWIMWVDHEIAWDELPEAEEIVFVTHISNMFEPTIKSLYDQYKR